MSIIDNSIAMMIAEQGGGSSVTVEPLSVTENGTYTASTGYAYSPVSVNVQGGTPSLVLPDTYDALDYIELPDTSIDGATGITISNQKITRYDIVELVAECTGSGENDILGYPGWSMYCSQGIVQYYNNLSQIGESQYYGSAPFIARGIYTAVTASNINIGFYEYNGSEYRYPTTGKIYDFKVLKDTSDITKSFADYNNIKIWLVPAQRKSDDKVGLYDLINETFYPSITGVEFVAGNVIPTPTYVNNLYTANDEGKVVVDETLVSQTSLTVTENDTYDTTTKSSVTVNVTSGAEIIPIADWNDMTTAQKQAKGLVGVQETVVGYHRGELINGADYGVGTVPVLQYCGTQNYNNSDAGISYTIVNDGIYQIMLTATNGDTGTKNNLAITVNGTAIESEYIYPLINNNCNFNMFKCEINATAGDVISFTYTDGVRYNNAGIQLFVFTDASLPDMELYDSQTNNGVSFMIDIDGYYVQLDNCGYYSGGNTFGHVEVSNEKKMSTATPGNVWYGVTFVVQLTSQLPFALINKTIHQNGIYTATNENADGYARVTVNVGASRMTKILLWGEEDYSVHSDLNTTYALEDNLSGYDEIIIVSSTTSDAPNGLMWENRFDTAVCLETNRTIAACIFNQRAWHLQFTDTTFTQILASSSEGDGYKPYVYKIYGCKW